ncbi:MULTISPECIES: conjugal transfer protein TraL [Thalassospira]|jgi:CobQ/CobB/MinD/ParA nucleotide binding domain|uniref:Conjugal transfer protein TraL n=1 Tax=Thalassospira lohafexi TaxID=744227 RepID=A0A2N3L1J5_9PROT|nr:conjugal transfer protein TraL [Thalassospira lohafexi]PKR56590.1 conjugal transfer protein TraL [Thalassospira lohafexi]|tara:strand:- start:3911 stop:4657 length:747 start_codon:yes stop_codon:yes gene_type:complete
MALINITLQGKGGVGKSFINSLLMQYYLKRGLEVQGFDTDPVNQTFAGYKAFPVKSIQLGEREDEINPRFFDDLIEDLVALPENAVANIDNGSSTFLPLLSYLLESQVLTMLRDAGHDVRLHCVIVGGQALEDTMRGLAEVLVHLPDIPVVVWLNEYVYGRILRARPGSEPEGFEQSALYKKNKVRFYSLVHLPAVRQSTYGHDIAQMTQSHLTFDEAVASDQFKIMAKQRLKTTWTALYGVMEEAML